MKPKFFETPDKFRDWLKENHHDVRELWVGFHKRESGKPSITWPQAVDQALCFGWIDGVRRSVNASSYMIRFTPRKARSTWSAVNIARAKELLAQGLMRPAGVGAFEQRSEEKSAIYSYEQRKTATLDKVQEEQFRKNAEAWKFFQEQPPWYRRTATWWMISAKKEETREKRLAMLIEYSEREKPIPPLARPGGKKARQNAK
ncbi:MAG TPA: YdeI/OmpD-associated family protein [Terriglobales bacterium]|jgi:uncharacterized protein YdeI (YjbR/CyaY-like superfamily)|nr:YdeI/OmpD-associated family protein [Terriglobales bacterium]